MGVVNSGTVFGVYTYEAEKEDELSFKDGDQMKVLKKGDEDETEWWWASKDGREGYIPRNLVAVSLTGATAAAVKSLLPNLHECIIQ